MLFSLFLVDKMNIKYNLLKNHLLKLMPFFCSTIAYFIFVHGTGDLITTVLKCSPIVSLIFYVISEGFQDPQNCTQSQYLLLGLIFSCIGDILLNIDHFPHGMFAFAFAQLFYIRVFGWKPLELKIAVVLYIFAFMVVASVYKKLDNILTYGLPIYAVLLTTQCWRSLARVQRSNHLLRIFCGIGSILFVISDTLIVTDMFLFPFNSSRIWIMSTYYLAQFAITVSAVNDKYQITTQRISNYQHKNIKDWLYLK